MKTYTLTSLHRIPLKDGYQFRFDTGTWQVTRIPNDLERPCELCGFHRSPACPACKCYTDDHEENFIFDFIK